MEWCLYAIAPAFLVQSLQLNRPIRKTRNYTAKYGARIRNLEIWICAACIIWLRNSNQLRWETELTSTYCTRVGLCSSSRLRAATQPKARVLLAVPKGKKPSLCLQVMIIRLFFVCKFKKYNVYTNAKILIYGHQYMWVGGSASVCIYRWHIRRVRGAADSSSDDCVDSMFPCVRNRLLKFTLHKV